MAALTSLLARDEVVSVETIEAALQRQVLEGGDLDTALLELGALPENTLSAYRAASYGLRPASRADVMHPDVELLSKLSLEQAEKYRLAPLSQLDDRLRVAAARPLSTEEEQALVADLGQQVEVRIAVAARVEAALAAFYGLGIPSRLRRLAEQLDQVPEGAIPTILPPQQEQEALQPPSAPPHPATGSRPAAPATPPPRRPEVDLDRLSRPLPIARPADLRPKAASSVSIAPMVSVTADGPGKLTPPVPPGEETSGTVRSERRSDPSGGDEAERDGEVPLRPSRHLFTPSRPRMRRVSVVPRGPLTSREARELIDTATDRDAIVDIFFSYARQFFDCAVLLAVRSDVLLGMEAHGLGGGVDIDGISVPVVNGASVHDSVQSLLPRVVHLARQGADKALPAALGRLDAQPAALIPVCIRQRAVAVLYGDRDGESFTLEDLGNLLGVMPSVVRAFERVIRGRKLLAVQAGRRARASLPPDALPSPSFAPDAEAGAELESAHAVPTEATRAAPAKGAAEPDIDIARRPTVPLPTQEAEDLARARRSGAPSASSDAPPAAEVARARPPSRRPANHPTKPPPGTGQYRGGSTMPPERLGPGSPGASEPAAAPQVDVPSTSAPPKHREHRSDPAGRPARPSRSSAPARPPLASERPVRPTVAGGDHRSEGSMTLPTDVVRVPSGIQDAVSASTAPPAAHPPLVDVFEPSIVVDMGTDLTAMVDELCKSGPDDEGPAVEALLSVGEVALPLLADRFPGPLWFDRHRPHRRMPVAADVSAVARAFIAFGHRATPWLARLLTSKDSDVRFYAVLLASEAAHEQLLAPMFDAIFDPDGQVRLLARDTLTSFIGMDGFSDAVAQLRGRAGDSGLATTTRVDAVTALQAVRDAASVPLLVALADTPEPQLAEASHEALVRITGHDFGRAERKWRGWLGMASDQARVEWLIDGLTGPSEAVRGIAGNELQKATQVYYGYVASAPKRERERIRERYLRWWHETQPARPETQD